MKNIRRKFILGDEWFFFKIYTGVKTADDLLTNHLMPIINIWRKKNYINKWFFIRYYDTDFHLRIRVHLTDKKNILPIINDLNSLLSTLIRQNLVWKFQTDIYTRELERYGIERIEEIEIIFYYDSEMIIKILNYIEKTDNQNTRWLVGLYIIDSLLNMFKVPIERKKALMEKYVFFFSAEMNYNKNLKRQLSLKYRKNKKDVNDFLSISTVHNQLKLFVLQRDKEIEQPLSKILHRELSFDSISELIFNISHMSLNRLYRTKSRENEFVSYRLLLYYYQSKIAQLKYCESTK